MMKNLLKSYSRNTRGNVAMMLAFLSVALLGMIGLATDGTRMMSAQSKLAMVADNAAVAGAYAAENDKQNREEVTRKFIDENAFHVLPSQLDSNYKIEFNDASQELTVGLSTKTDLMFGGFLGKKTAKLSAETVTSYATQVIDPVTIAFALDVSGSMDWDSSNGQKKIDVLKSATGLLFEAVEDGTKRPDLLKEAIRTGMSAYNTAIVADQDMAKGWDHLEGAVDTLIADGGTNSTPALQNSYDQILADRAYRKSRDADFDFSRLKEYVLFMTDGDNNQDIWDAESAQVCSDMRQDGIEIFSVAFTAPDKGQILLWNCASWDDPANNTGPTPDGNGNTDAGDGGKCMNNGAQGEGEALGHCKGDDGGNEKSRYYFDADDAESFKAAFVLIGEEISKSNIRIKS